jgi:lipid II:glycine glycyltransferase (peptidoglycan interpeptide bridge formation enzyme)
MRGCVAARSELEVVYARELVREDARDYDAFVDAAGGAAYTQARAWAPAALAGRRFAPRSLLVRRAGRVIGAALVLRARAVGPVVAPAVVVERGPVVDALEELDAVLAALRRACLRRGVLRLQVMPYWAGHHADAAEQILARSGYRSVQTTGGAHARTLRVELREPLFAGKAGESLRRKIRQAEKAGCVARRGARADVATLARLHDELMAGQDRGAKPPAYWEALGALAEDGARGGIFVADHEGAPVSALYASRHGRLATFVVGASSTADKPFSKMVPSMTAAIRWALAEGCEAFDMGGIPLETDADDKRRSIAQFKLDFAKEPVRLVREHARWL